MRGFDLSSGKLFLLTLFGLAVPPLLHADSAPSAPPILALQAKQFFQTTCYGCHGQPGHAPEAGLDILNAKYLIGTALVIPGSSGYSVLYQKLSTGQMPPVGDTFPDGTTPPRPSASDMALVKNWIDQGAPDWNGISESQNPIVAYEDVVNAIAKDIATLTPLQAGQTRYLSLVHLKNQNLSDDDIDATRLAMTKLLNSLSLNPQIVAPVAIDADQLIYRVDLESYKLLPKSWDRYETVYPLGIQSGSSAEKQILKLSGGRFPFLRADWFVEFGVRPPLYHDVLYTDQLGIFSATGALSALEQALGVDRLGNILNGRVVRAGFDSSGVSVNNRILERHDIGNYAGAYWLSYDFLGNSPDPQLRQNIFSYPLGPADAFPNADNTFKHAGGEVIFNLPNGLQAYMLVNNVGLRLDKALTQIVTDPARPDHAVENGVSCFRCHNEGMILKQDLLRAYIQYNSATFAADLNVLLDLYQDNSLFLAAQQTDLNRFLAADLATGVVLQDPEPVSRIVQYFEEDMNGTRVASEFYLSPDALNAKIDGSDSLKTLLGAVRVPGGSVKRGFMLDNFQTILNLINATQPQ